jgi:hypothetical protein
VGGPSLDPEAERKRREAEEEVRIAELRAHGTAVTPEAFAGWKAKFDAEMALQRAKLQPVDGGDKRGKLTGKQWFMQQEAMHREVGQEGSGGRNPVLPCRCMPLSVLATAWLGQGLSIATQACRLAGHGNGGIYSRQS